MTKYDLHLKRQRNELEVAMRIMENNRPKLLEKFKNIRIYSTDNSENKNVGLNETVPEVTISEQFYQIDKYNSIPEPHAKLWMNYVQRLYNSYCQLMMVMLHAKDPPYKKAFEAAVTRL